MFESMVFYKSFMEAASTLPAEEYKEAISAVLAYGMDGIEPENLSPYAKMFFLLAKPQIDANNAKREAGRKGGDAKRDNTNLKKIVAKPSTATVCYTETGKQNVANVNVNANANANENENVNANENVNENVNVKERYKAQTAPSHTRAQTPEQQKKTYGEFQNVKLTESEYQKLNENLGEASAAEYIDRLGEYMKSKGKRYKSHYATILNWHRRNGTKNLEQQTNGNALDENVPIGFDEFWYAYPKHSGIDDAKREWSMISPDEELRDRILQAIAWRKGTANWKEQQGKFIPAPAKWLHDHGWTDYKPPKMVIATREEMGSIDPTVEENWNAIMGDKIKAIMGS